MINIRSKGLRDYLLRILDKKDGIITEEDAKNISHLEINSLNINGDNVRVYFDDLSYFPNLEELILCNIIIYEDESDNIFNLKNLKSLELYNSCFKDLKGIEKMENLEVLIFTGGLIFSPECIGKIPKLEKLVMNNLIINNLDFLKNSKSLKNLNIARSEIKNPLSLKDIKSLEIISSMYCDIPFENYDELYNLKKVLISLEEYMFYKEKIDNMNKSYEINVGSIVPMIVRKEV